MSVVGYTQMLPSVMPALPRSMSVPRKKQIDATDWRTFDVLRFTRKGRFSSPMSDW